MASYLRRLESASRETSWGVVILGALPGFAKVPSATSCLVPFFVGEGAGRSSLRAWESKIFLVGSLIDRVDRRPLFRRSLKPLSCWDLFGDYWGPVSGFEGSPVERAPIHPMTLGCSYSCCRSLQPLQDPRVSHPLVWCPVACLGCRPLEFHGISSWLLTTGLVTLLIVSLDSLIQVSAS